MNSNQTKNNITLHGIALGNLALINQCNENMAKAKDVETFNHWKEQKNECLQMYKEAMQELMSANLAKADV